MLLPFYLILIKNNEPSLSLSYGSYFAEFLYDCYLITPSYPLLAYLLQFLGTV